jgi:hypothetical protein
MGATTSAEDILLIKTRRECSTSLPQFCPERRQLPSPSFTLNSHSFTRRTI